MFNILANKNINLNFIIFIFLLVMPIAIFQLRAEYWNETYNTPDGISGTVFDYTLNKYNTASAYAAVTKTPGRTGTQVDTSGYVESDYYVKKSDTDIFSDGYWQIDIWYTKDPKNNVKTEFIGEAYYSIVGGKKFWFKKPKEVKGTSTSLICNNSNVSDDVFNEYLASTEADFPRDDAYYPSTDEEYGIFHITPDPFFWGLGETHSFVVITDSPYFEVNWYLKKKNSYDELGRWLSANSGGSDKTEGELLYTFSSENKIEPYTDYILIARIERLSDNTIYDETFEISIGP